ncbi:ParA family protein [Ideonella margarita]|jgi:chromosome partitioning protein|uniref:ParA family protein n=1 Tax=Ideonella margarita TaxID=2984191 RepID=A0ABU9C2N3_9BURK
MAKARVLAVTNRKGGSGKTSTSVNLSAELAAQGHRVLLIDLDTQGHCAIGLGVPAVRNGPTVHGFMAGRHSLSAAIVPSAWAGLHLIPADPLFEHGSGQQQDHVLWTALQQEELLTQYDVVVLDTPPSLDALLLNALCAADRVLVPFVPHFLAGEGVRQLARVLFRVASRGGNDRLRVLGFLPVMQDARIGQHRSVTDSLAQQFGSDRILPGIRNDIRVAEAFAAGKPVREHAPNARATADYALAVLAAWRRWT